MNLEAFKKLASSSKVLMYLLFIVGITVAWQLKAVDVEWWKDTMRAGFIALMGGYSIVEAARAVMTGRVEAAKVLMDPKAALDELKTEPATLGTIPMSGQVMVPKGDQESGR